MNDEEKRNLKILLVKLSAVYQTRLDDAALSAFAREVEDMTFRDVMNAIGQYRKDPKNKRMPTAFDLRNLIDTPVSYDDDAREVASRIVQAMAKYGYTNPDRAKTFLGPVGWLVVEREGGWAALCQRTNDERLPALKAQWRDLAKSLMTRSKAGILDTPPRLPAPDRSDSSSTGLTRVAVPYIDRRMMAAGSDDYDE